MLHTLTKMIATPPPTFQELAGGAPRFPLRFRVTSIFILIFLGLPAASGLILPGFHRVITFGFRPIRSHWLVVDKSTCWNSDYILNFMVPLQNHTTITAVDILCKSPLTTQLSSHPKYFDLIGYSSKYGEITIKKYRYNRGSSAFQRFDVPRTSSIAFDQVAVRFHSNWGDPNVTCVERVSLYGRVFPSIHN